MDIEAKSVYKLEDDDHKYGQRPERVNPKQEYYAKKDDYLRLDQNLPENNNNANSNQEQQDLTPYQ